MTYTYRDSLTTVTPDSSEHLKNLQKSEHNGHLITLLMIMIMVHAHDALHVNVCAGDSGYPLEPWLLTPLASPSTRAEVAYNSAHMKTRNVIERCFGILKSRFRCLDKSGGTLLYSAEKTCKIVMAAAVLHNFCINNNIATAIDENIVQRHLAIQPAPQLPPPAAACSASELRQRIIRQF